LTRRPSLHLGFNATSASQQKKSPEGENRRGLLNPALCGKANRGAWSNCRRLFHAYRRTGSIAPFRFAIRARHRLETFSNCYFATLSDSFFRGEGYMKNAYRSFDLNTAEFDNWLEPATTKMVKHAKSNKNKLWGDFEGSRINRKKKRDAKSFSWAK
jgi:hypothetical protein